MTSNIGARLITDKRVSFGFSQGEDDGNKDIKASVLAELKNAFRPEFINRVDDIIVFSKLTKPQIELIAEKMLENLTQRTKAINIDISFEPSVKSALAEIGFDAIYGARPLRREIQNKIEDALSEKILDGSIKTGDKVLCGYNGEKFIFETVK
jgi:ATP-dependent Clp protease ATP-binding subunit ClpC